MYKPLKPGHQRLFELISQKSAIPSDTRVLELGCSYGEFVYFLRQQGYDVEQLERQQAILQKPSSK